MTAPAADRALPRPFVAAFVYALRVCVPPKRAALLALPCTGALLFGLLARTVDEPTPAARFNTISGALFGLILPLACLVVGDAVLGAEVRAGTFGLTWLSPVRFSTIVLARWSAGAVLVGLLFTGAVYYLDQGRREPTSAGLAGGQSSSARTYLVAQRDTDVEGYLRDHVLESAGQSLLDEDDSVEFVDHEAP